MADLDRVIAAIRPGERQRIAFLGVGNALDGDDAAGVLVVRRARQKLASLAGANSPQGDHFLLIEAGSAPENFTGSLRRFAPDRVVWIDAADFGARPGCIRCFDLDDVDAVNPSSHILPPAMLAKYLAGELGCPMMLVGIQPERLDFDRPLSHRVSRAVRALGDAIATLLAA